jgi:hypothetical protein
MRRLKAVLGYTLAALALVVALATFGAMPAWERAFVAGTGLRISPWFTGDEIAYAVGHGGYETRIHRPVFQALVGERREGFVQVDWAPAAALPATIDEEIDYNRDGVGDFRIRLEGDKEEALLTPIAPEVGKLLGTYRLTDARSVRVVLANTPR